MLTFNRRIKYAYKGINMRNGAAAAKAVLAEIRDKGNGLAVPVIAGMIESSLPDSNPARLGFMLVLGEYLRSALNGAAIDPEHLDGTG